jgi:hypothetical protein
MDLKWGINESFTVDVTLVPDFSQIQADDQVLNLTPYEIQYNEKRQFFTEGTEVFSKADIFYSRRIGAKPRYFSDAESEAAQAGLDIISNPLETSMINATKISGRTRSGLGLGFFNAMTGRAFAVMEDTVTGEQRKFMTEPFTNYNMMVIDQSLPNASYISLVNTNVMRSGPATGRNYTANVSATDMQFNTANRLFSIKAVGAVSQKYYSDRKPGTGHSVILSGGKTGGRYTVRYDLQAISDNYDPNDMGYLKKNNLLSNGLTFGYNLYTPHGPFYSSRNSLSVYYDRLYAPFVFNDFKISMSSSSVLRSFWTLTVSGKISPSGSDDYNEPRVDGRMYHRQPSASLEADIGSDPRRPFMIEMEASAGRHYLEPGRYNAGIELKPRVRFSNRLSGLAGFTWQFENNDEGFAGIADGEIIFGQRDNRIMSCELDFAYMFSARSNLSFRLREYWAIAEYSGRYYLLNYDGTLSVADIVRHDNTSYNALNADLSYSWRFAPGSELTLVFKNALYDYQTDIPGSFSDNLKGLWELGITRSLSCKVIWYLDYHSISARGLWGAGKKDHHIDI